MKVLVVSTAAGREFVRAYVEFVHYAERLHHAAAGGAGHNGEAPEHKPAP